MNHAEIQGERIAYREAGQGTPVLLIHSLGTSSEIWEPTIAQLADKFRVIAMDCRGHGGSTNRGGFSVEAIAEDAHALMTKLGAERFHYAGISMGGLYGIKGYALARERFLSLTLADSFAAPNPMGPARVAQTREILAQSSMLEFGKSYVADTLLPTTASLLHQRIAEIIASMKTDDYMQTLEAIMFADVTAHLPEIEIPTLIVVGAEDKRTPVSISESLRSAIRGSKLEIIPEAGHLAVLDRPERFNTILKDFLLSL